MGNTAILSETEGANKTCRLCRSSTELRNSHIFPRCFIRLVREEDTNSTFNGRFYEMDAGASSLVQDGPKEPLFCDRCEQKIGRNEKYFKEAIHLSRHHIEITQNQQVACIRGLDYAKTKLFLLSVMYWMSVSSLPQFASVSLGEHEDALRRMIDAENPARDDLYPIAAMIPLINGKMEECLLCTPSVFHHNDVTAYHIILGGILYSFFVRRLSDELNVVGTLNACLNHKWILNETGDWLMPLIDILDVPFVRELFERRANSANSPTDR